MGCWDVGDTFFAVGGAWEDGTNIGVGVDTDRSVGILGRVEEG